MSIGVLMCIHIADNEFLFKKSLDSLIDQTFKSFELLLIADGKLKQTQEKILIDYKELFDKRGIDFKLIRKRETLEDIFSNCNV